jgi:hypothetical protein
MKCWYLFLLLLLPAKSLAQGFTLDTIRVSSEDNRNIHRSTQLNQTELSLNKDNSSHFILDRTKLRLGANIGLSLSKNYTYLGIGPQIGYQFSNYFMAGAGIKYYHLKRNLSDYERKNNLLGLNLFGYVYPVKFITLFAQPELNYIWSNITYNTGEKVTNKGIAPSLVVGTGLKLGYNHITINYDLVKHSNSPHPQGFYLGISAFF